MSRSESWPAEIRALLKRVDGAGRDPRLEATYRWLRQIQAEDGGWRCAMAKLGNSPATDASNPGTALVVLGLLESKLRDGGLPVEAPNQAWQHFSFARRGRVSELATAHWREIERNLRGPPKRGRPRSRRPRRRA